MTLTENIIQIRRLSDPEIPAALDLAWEVFSEYESPDYSTEGIEEFRKCLHDEEYLHGIDHCGAFDSGNLIGMIGIRSNQEHICFFFVDGQYHRKGIGTKLFGHLLENHKGNIITVNSSPYGLGFYKKLEFVPAEEEKTINGIRFTPMIYMKNIYPTEESMRALTAFQIYKGSGEWFDLSKRPIERESFDFGTDGDDETELRKEGYVINDKCIGCGSCVAVCPQNCISTDSIPFDIHASHCLHCGNCMNACPAGAVERR